MRSDLTFIAVVLDRSGSMAGLQMETIAGLNKFIADQQALPGEALFTLAQFDHEYMVTYDAVDLKKVVPLNTETYSPRGWTALLDAMGRTINSVGQKLALMPESERPGKVIFVVQTDGEENKSTEFTAAKIKEMVAHQTSVYSWEFVFLGANIDAVKTGAQFGIRASSAMTYAASSHGTGVAFNSLSRSIGSYRTGNTTTASFSDDDKAANDPNVVVVKAQPYTPDKVTSMTPELKKILNDVRDQVAVITKDGNK